MYGSWQKKDSIKEIYYHYGDDLEQTEFLSQFMHWMYIPFVGYRVVVLKIRFTGEIVCSHNDIDISNLAFLSVEELIGTKECEQVEKILKLYEMGALEF